MREQWEAGVGVHVTGVGCTASAIDAADERLVLLVEREDRRQLTQRRGHAVPVRGQTGGESEQFALDVVALRTDIEQDRTKRSIYNGETEQK